MHTLALIELEHTGTPTRRCTSHVENSLKSTTVVGLKTQLAIELVHALAMSDIVSYTVPKWQSTSLAEYELSLNTTIGSHGNSRPGTRSVASAGWENLVGNFRKPSTGPVGRLCQDMSWQLFVKCHS